MNRSGYLAGAVLVATLGAGAALGAAPALDADPRQAIELRTYSFASEEKLQSFAGYLEKTAIPALNRAGAKPVGAFRLMKADNPKLDLQADELKLYVLIPHPTLDSAFTLTEKLFADAEFSSGSKAVLGTPMKDPVFLRCETQLMRGFSEWPAVASPAKGADRVLQLRIYESHNDERALRKIEMFNEGGEIALFRRVGINPVFFGQSIAGTLLPNLTYMAGFDSPEAMKSAWDTFLADPQWTALKDDPKYTDTVSRITNLILRPVAGSQI
jgi:hypothetical protein